MYRLRIRRQWRRDVWLGLDLRSPAGRDLPY
jgi:hypothetical protein